MNDRPNSEFGKRRPATPQPAAPVKRSSHVALLLMGTLAVGSTAYAMMPRENCQPPAPGTTPPGMATPTAAQPATNCSRGYSTSSGSHGGYWSSRSSFFSSDSSSSHSSSGTSSDSGAGGVTRGGFGSFARSFSGHFSTGG